MQRKSDMTNYPFKSLGGLLLSLAVVAGCGGSGDADTVASTATDTTSSQSPSTTLTYPSGYVRLIGRWAPVDTSVSAYTVNQAVYKQAHKGCNAVRALAGAAEQAELSADMQDRLNLVETWYYYDQATSAARKEEHGPSAFDFVDLTRYQREQAAVAPSAWPSLTPPDCQKVEEKRPRHAEIWTSDNKRYSVYYDALGHATKVGQDPDDLAARSTAPPAGSEPVDVNAAGSIEKCYPWWTTATRPADPTDCMWDRYANVIFRNLPMPLKHTVTVANDRLSSVAVEVSPMIPAGAGPWGSEPFYQVPTVQP